MSSLEAQTKTLTWGASKDIDFVVPVAGGFLLPTAGLSTAQLVAARSDEPIVWLVEFTIDFSGFDGETAPVTVTLMTQVGVGQSMSTIKSGSSIFVIPPPYAQTSDQGFIPAAALNISAVATAAAPFTVPGDHRITLGCYVSPWNGSMVEHERRCARQFPQ